MLLDSKVTLEIHMSSQFGPSLLWEKRGPNTSLCSGLSSPERRLQVESAQVLIVFMATANIGMANLERLITALIL